MRPISSLAALPLVLIAACTASASIHIQAGDYVRMTDGPGGLGGVFNAHETNSSGSAVLGGIFPTFCVEVSEHIPLPGTYYVQNLGTTASTSGNVLTSLAGWIYANYVDGILVPNQAALLAANAAKFNNSVQIAIWMEVLNHNTTNPPTIPWTAASLASNYISGGVSNYDPSVVAAALGTSYSGSDHHVQIMNLRSSSDLGHARYIQDQLVRNTVPEATSLLIWTLLVSCGTMMLGRSRVV